MRYSTTINLIDTTITGRDENGNPISSPTTKTIYANEFSVGYNEFYQASQSGLKPSKIFDIHSFEYDGQTKLVHDSITYQIIRADVRGQRTRLVCERVGRDV